MFLFRKKFQWGAPDANGIAVGIHLQRNRISGNDVCRWSCALKNTGREEVPLVLYDESKRLRKFVLQIFDDSGSGPIDEIPVALKYEQAAWNTTVMQPPLILKLKAEQTEEIDVVQSALDLSPGSYLLRVAYMMGEHQPECVSGFVKLVVARRTSR